MVRFHRPGTGGGFTAEQLVKAINKMDGINSAHVAETGTDYVIEWQMHDPDNEYTSALTVDRESGVMMEMVLRFGPVGRWENMDIDDEEDIEGMWVNTVLDSASEAGVMEIINGRGMDLGHKYVSEYARPHVRVSRDRSGYTEVNLQNVVDFIETLNRRHRKKFGTLEDRMMDAKFSPLLAE